MTQRHASPPEPSHAPHAGLVPLLGFALTVGVALIYAADRDGYEGDDLNSLCAMFQLDAALADQLSIYRYAWQPLSYRLGAMLFRLTGSPTLVFLLAPLACTATLTTLVAAMRRVARRPHAFVAYPALLVLLPELWFSGLYYNTTILGMPWVVAAVWLLLEPATPRRALVAGALTGIAILLRMDFVIVCPMLAVLAWHHDRSLQRPLYVALGVVGVLALAWAGGLLDPQAIVAIHRESTAEMRARAHEPGWDLYFKVWVLATSLHALGFALVGSGSLLLVSRALRDKSWTTLAFALAALPLLYPAANLLSVKYLLPLLAFLPLGLVKMVETLEDAAAGVLSARQGGAEPANRLADWTDRALIAAAVIALGVSVEPTTHKPFLRASVTDPRQIGTHDGYRTFGAYLVQMLRVARQVEPHPHQLAARELWAFASEAGPGDLVLAGADTYFAPGAVGWRHLQLLAESEGHRGTVTGKQLLRFDLGPRRVWLADAPERAIAALPAASREAALVVDLRDAALAESEAKALAFVRGVLSSRTAAGTLPR